MARKKITGEGKTSEEYWKLREEELKKIKQDMIDDNKYKKELSKLYNLAQEEIEKDIAKDIASFARKEEISMAEAKKLISKVDVENYSSRAKKYVEEANKMRAEGKKVTTADFSDKVNKELREYNVTMRTNRLELLQAKMNLNTVSLANQEELMLQKKLATSFIAEYERQAGILGLTVPSSKQLDNLAKSFVEAEFRNVLFSDNIWQNQKELQEGLENALRRSIIRGENPRKTGAQLRKLVKKEFELKKFAADRIAITETARIQTTAQKKSFEDGDYEEYGWAIEPSACDKCKAMEGKTFKVADMMPGENAVPLHPFDRCSHFAIFDRDKWDADLKARGL